MGIALFQMAVFIDTTEAKSRDSDGDGTPDVGKFNYFTILLWAGRYHCWQFKIKKEGGFFFYKSITL